MACPAGPQELFHLHSARSLSGYDPGEAGRGGMKFDAFGGCCVQRPKKRRGRDVVESLMTTGKAAVWGGVILKLLLESSPASLLERIHRNKWLFPTLH